MAKRVQKKTKGENRQNIFNLFEDRWDSIRNTNLNKLKKDLQLYRGILEKYNNYVNPTPVVKNFDIVYINAIKPSGQIHVTSMKLKPQSKWLNVQDLENIHRYKTLLVDTIHELDMNICYNESGKEEIDFLLEAIPLIQRYEKEVINDSKIPTIQGPKVGGTGINKYFNVTKKRGAFEVYVEYVLRLEPDKYDSNMLEHVDMSICKKCNITMDLDWNHSVYVCKECCYVSDVLYIDGDKRHQDAQTDTQNFTYKRMNHFKEVLAQVQAKESCNIPDQVFRDVNNELRKLKNVYKIENINYDHVRALLKKTNHTREYEHTFFIMYTIKKQTPRRLSTKSEDIIINYFMMIQEPYELYKPPRRQNFISYSFTFRQLFYKMEVEDNLEDCIGMYKLFPKLSDNTGDNLEEHERCWFGICKHLDWPYHGAI